VPLENLERLVERKQLSRHEPTRREVENHLATARAFRDAANLRGTPKRVRDWIPDHRRDCGVRDDENGSRAIAAIAAPGVTCVRDRRPGWRRVRTMGDTIPK